MEIGNAPKNEKQPLIHRIVASDKIAEIASAQIIAGLENSRDMRSRPENFGLSHDQVGSIPLGSIESWTFSHIGDVWEVANLFTATRLAMAGVNEAFKRVTKREIPDEACFWASLITSVTIPSLMELNILPLPWIGEKLNNVSDPADLFGVGVGALVIVATHYTSKYREPIKKVVSLVGARIAEGGRFVTQKFKQFDEKVTALGRLDVAPNVAIETEQPNKE